MFQFELSVTESPAPDLLAQLSKGLTEHAAPFVEGPGFQPLAVAAHDTDGALAGAVTGKLNWNWLHVNLLWVRPDSRGSGLGGMLLERIENEARSRGCSKAHLDTLSYQAPAFYERQGYEIFASLRDYPAGHSRVFLSKNL